MSNVKTAKDYKDRLFRMIFNGKEKLLELYNAMNGSDYNDASELQVVTLENAIYLLMKMMWLMCCMMNCFCMSNILQKMPIYRYAAYFMQVTHIRYW